MSIAIRKRDILLFYCSVMSTRAKSCYATNEVRTRLEKSATTPSIEATLGGMSFIPRLTIKRLLIYSSRRVTSLAASACKM